MNWIIIAILVILAFVFLRIRHVKHKIFLIVIIFALLFFYTTGSQILSEQDVDWKSVSGVEQGLRVYFTWVGGAFGNLKVLTTNAIKMDWGIENATENIKTLEKTR